MFVLHAVLPLLLEVSQELEHLSATAKSDLHFSVGLHEGITHGSKGVQP